MSMTDPATPADRGGHPLADGSESSGPTARARWEAAAAAVLRKAGRLPHGAPDSDAWTRLARTTVEGLAVPPLGTADDARALPTLAALAASPGEAPYLRGSTANGGWEVRTAVDATDAAAANAAALADLAGGGHSLWIRIGAGGVPVGDLAAALDGIELSRTPVVLDGGNDEILAAADVLDRLVTDRGTPLHPGGSLGADPLSRAARAPGQVSPNLGQVPGLATRARALGIGALVVDGSAVHERGAGDAQEIGYTLAAGAAYLRALTAAGIGIDGACSLIGFRYAVTDEQFTSIAKLRAARFAWHRLTELCGVAASTRAQYQHAVTSCAMMTRYDRHVNMLRGTIAAFAAAAGGARAITVLPFDAAGSEPDEFSRRMARNVSVLLSGESDVDAVADPAGGAYAVEELTVALAEAAWAEFGRIEAAGGIEAALADGSVAARIDASRHERDRRIAKRSWPITGVSEFPLAGEQPAGPRPSPATTERWAAPFEELRDTPPRSPLALVRLGTRARSSARFAFAENLLIAGGVPLRAMDGPERTADGNPDDTAGSTAGGAMGSAPDADPGLVATLRETGCPAVLFAGSDADYQLLLQDAVTAARTAGVRAAFLAGRPQALLAEWPDDLLDGTVAQGDDVLDFLRTVRGALVADEIEVTR